MSVVTNAIEVAHKLVSTVPGMFDYRKGQTWKRFNYWISHMADVQATSEEMVMAIAKKYLNADLTPNDCASIIGILGLQEVVTSYKDQEILGQVELAYLAKRIDERSPIIIGLMNGAKEEIEREVLYTYRHQAVDEFDSSGNPRTKEDKIAGLLAFGMDPETAKRCEWSGNTVMTQDGNPVDFFGMAGIKA